MIKNNFENKTRYTRAHRAHAYNTHITGVRIPVRSRVRPCAYYF